MGSEIAGFAGQPHGVSSTMWTVAGSGNGMTTPPRTALAHTTAPPPAGSLVGVALATGVG